MTGDITLHKRMGAIVDGLVKQALITLVTSSEFIDNDFPLEMVRILVGGTKATGDVLRQISDHWGR